MDAKLSQRVIHERVRVGYAPSPTATIIPIILTKYYELAPGASVTFHDLTPEEMLEGLRKNELHAALTMRPRPPEMRGLKFHRITRNRLGVICSPNHPFNELTRVDPALVASQKLVVYRSKDFPEYHDRIAEILNVDHRKLIITKECDNALGLITSVESAAGIAIIAKSIMALAGTRVKFVPFSKSHFLDVGLLHSSRGFSKSIKTLIAACAACRDT